MITGFGLAFSTNDIWACSIHWWKPWDAVESLRKASKWTFETRMDLRPQLIDVVDCMWRTSCQIPFNFEEILHLPFIYLSDSQMCVTLSSRYVLGQVCFGKKLFEKTLKKKESGSHFFINHLFIYSLWIFIQKADFLRKKWCLINKKWYQLTLHSIQLIPLSPTRLFLLDQWQGVEGSKACNPIGAFWTS